MDQITFKMGVFQDFIATRSFALGAFNVQVAAGAELQFDGSQVQYAGQTYALPQLRAALTAGWITPTAEYNADDPRYKERAKANIKVRPATDSGGQARAAVASVTTSDDERVVMNYADHASDTRELNHSKRMKTASSGGIESQDGVSVRTLGPAKSRTSLTAESAGAALRQAENVQIKPGRGRSPEEHLAQMSPEERDIYLASKAAAKTRFVDTNPVTVATVKTAAVTQSEGFTSKQSVGGGIEIADPTTGTGKAKASTYVEDGITFQNTNGPEKLEPQVHPRSPAAQQPVMAKDGTADVRRQIAKMVCPDFPDAYDFAAPERKKLARLQADFEDRPDILKAVFAAESDAFKATLVAEFPQAFQG